MFLIFLSPAQEVQLKCSYEKTKQFKSVFIKLSSLLKSSL